MGVKYSNELSKKLIDVFIKTCEERIIEEFTIHCYAKSLPAFSLYETVGTEYQICIDYVRNDAWEIVPDEFKEYIFSIYTDDKEEINLYPDEIEDINSVIIALNEVIQKEQDVD